MILVNIIWLYAILYWITFAPVALYLEVWSVALVIATPVSVIFVLIVSLWFNLIFVHT